VAAILLTLAGWCDRGRNDVQTGGPPPLDRSLMDD
jgi:hypothetical protein